jgi:thymidylate synthase
VCYFRSHDICLGYGANAYALTAIMFKVLNAVDKKIEIGTLTTISNNAHIYDTDIQVARRIAYG